MSSIVSLRAAAPAPGESFAATRRSLLTRLKHSNDAEG